LLGRALAFSLQHCLGHLLDKKRDTIAAFDDVLPNVGGKQLVASDPVYDRTDLSLCQSIKRKGGNVRSPDPGRLEVRPECHDQQYRERRDPVDEPTEDFQARRVHPMRILKDHERRILLCQRSHSGS
jgi:hypothetical protein